jgi:non-ribosomal peptide synthetase component F
LPELPIQYADYAVWQREQMNGELADRLRGYWSTQLAGAPPALQIPTDRPRPSTPTYSGGCLWLSLPADLISLGRAVSQRAGTTLYMTMLAAFDVFLSAYSGQEDLSIGTPVAGRTSVETEALIGFFINTIVMRTEFSGARTFRDVLEKVRETCLGAYAHQDFPLFKVVEAIRPPRDSSRNPLFQANFRVQLAPPRPLQLTGTTCRVIKVHPLGAKFDMALDLQVGEHELGGFFEYNEDIFTEATATRMVVSIERIFRAVLSDPDAPFRDLPAVSEVAQARLSPRSSGGSRPSLRGARRISRD